MSTQFKGKTFKGLGMRVRGYPDTDRQSISKKASQHKYSAIESFCGPGGLSLGLAWAGFDVLFSFDYDKYAVETHLANLSGKCIQIDARELDGDAILEATKLEAGDLALFAGGPPCQGFSKQRRGAHLGDDRNDLVLEYVRMVEHLQPRYFMFENVAVFGQARGKKYLAEMERRLRSYELTPAFYNSADYGVPQTRERFILVGRRLDQSGKFSIPKPTLNKWLTLADVLSDMPEPPLDYSEHLDFPNHQRARVTQLNIDRFSHVPQGGGWQDIPEHLRLDCHKNSDSKTGGWPDVYGRLKWNGQCPTITGGFDSFTRGRYGHPLFNRPLTPREAARIQGFPDSYRFHGTRGDIRSQIGNVVPPPLAEAVGLEILRALLISDGHINSPESDLQPATLNKPELLFATN